VSRTRFAAATSTLAAIFLVLSGIAIYELPGSCGEVGRPNLDFFARLALGIAGGLWIAGLVAVARRPRATRPQAIFAAVALLEACVGIGLVFYYRHHTGWYDHCG
jgi:uncharacterized membrane protein YfcA